ncbi:MAG: SurA N-terminal domain-containing protein [Candidatus Promineofilum sp.]|nr:SurA N-terminal domain-containing protein [Promineifilum sp.]
MNYRKFALLALITLLLAAACRTAGSSTTILPTATTAGEIVAAATLPPAVAATNTPVPPSPTPTEPLAAVVNGEQIFLSEFEAELARYNAQQGDAAADTTGYRDQVLNALIERRLIMQAATDDGVVVTPEMVDQRLTELRSAGDDGAFQTFLQTNGWTEEEFRDTLTAELVTSEMIARVTAGVPTTMEQVRASYIQMDDATLAQSVLERAQAGDDFAFLAEQNSVDRLTGVNGGDLGFFKIGSLLVPEVEAAAFALQPGEISDLISVTGEDGKTTYYIIKVTERDPNRELTVDDRYGLMQATFDAWLENLWATAVIERFIQ